MPKSYIPTGYHTVNPYLIVTEVAKLVQFLKDAFDAQELMRMDGPDGRIMHAAVRIGDSVVEMGGASEEWKATPGSLHIYMPNTDESYQRALNAGAVSLRAPEDMFYGERGASVRDPVGNMWHIATLIEELSLEEMKSRAAQRHSK